MNKCQWLSDEFVHICCCGRNKTYCADACPFYEKPSEAECQFYEEMEVKQDASGHDTDGCIPGAVSNAS